MTKTVEQIEALEYLGKHLRPHDYIYSVTKSVSNSGMFRHIDFYVFRTRAFFDEGENQIEHTNLSWHFANALGFPFKEKTGCVGVHGSGMDMGFFVVNAIERRIFDGAGRLHHVAL